MPADKISSSVADELLRIFEDPEAFTGDAWYIDDHDNGEMIHAKMFKMGDCNEIKGLCGSAAKKLFLGPESSLHANINRDVVDYLMDVTSSASVQNDIRLMIGKILANDHLFGYRQPVVDVLKKHEDLAERILHGMFLD